MRRLFRTDDAVARGITSATLRWGEKTGRWRRIERGVYGEGSDDPSPLDRARARVLATDRPARGGLAGVLLGLDAVALDDRPVRRDDVPFIVVAGLPCADGLQTMIDLAPTLDDDRWEQALESALRMRLTTIAEIEDALPALGRSRTPGAARIKRVLALRPAGAPPTESRLETLMVQLARTVPGVSELERQVEVLDDGLLVARVDLARTDLGFFVELDGQHHLGQPVYDSSRETAVVAATGWLCGRFTWHEVVRTPRTSARRLGAIAEQTRRRPLAS